MVKSSSSSSSRVLHTPNSPIPLPKKPTTTTNLQPKVEGIRKRPYKGVRMRSWGSWVSEIRSPYQKTRIWLGSYSTPEAAARAYDAALLCLKGSSAALNFPTSLPYHPPDHTTTIMSPKSIQRVAAAAANAATPTTSTPCPAISPSPFPPSPSSSPSSPSDTTEDSPSSTTTTTRRSCMVSAMEEDSWIDFGALQLPIFVDQLINPSISPWEELDEEVDFKLWSFC
ncbi:ethylene-responsive transcription factor ERF039-like [Elaeis guineensis]|uniref:Ethylene-responsive transcription factor ERF014-like n=1 Tax=Elaeis guineensis var. tenera TaxID=51953 RepID=A0A6I9RH24_ELAGV|nr:ethylene-responsive transcription factor ERF014-like [Elaeis guineensis]